MCYSVTTSLTAYLLGLLASTLIFYLDHPVIASLVGIYCGVQLAEGLIWYSLDTKNSSLNRYGTQLLTWNLSSHAFVTVCAAIYFGYVQTYRTGYRQKGYTKHEMLALFLLLAMAASVMVMMVALKKSGAVTRPLCEQEEQEEQEEDTSLLDQWSCRLWWNWSSLDGTVVSVGYIIQMVVILAALYVVYRKQLRTWYTVMAFLGLMLVVGVVVTVVAWEMRRRGKNGSGGGSGDHETVVVGGETVQKAVITGVSTMWCFASAVGAPVLGGVLWGMG